jgi:hypothetical protein
MENNNPIMEQNSNLKYLFYLIISLYFGPSYSVMFSLLFTNNFSFLGNYHIVGILATLYWMVFGVGALAFLQLLVMIGLSIKYSDVLKTLYGGIKQSLSQDQTRSAKTTNEQLEVMTSLNNKLNAIEKYVSYVTGTVKFMYEMYTVNKKLVSEKYNNSNLPILVSKIQDWFNNLTKFALYNCKHLLDEILEIECFKNLYNRATKYYRFYKERSILENNMNNNMFNNPINNPINNPMEFKQMKNTFDINNLLKPEQNFHNKDMMNCSPEQMDKMFTEMLGGLEKFNEIFKTMPNDVKNSKIAIKRRKNKNKNKK